MALPSLCAEYVLDILDRRQLMRFNMHVKQSMRCCADVYGAAFGRDLEPSREAGSVAYNIMASCIKMFRAGATSCTPAYSQQACCAGALLLLTFHYYALHGTDCIHARQILLCMCAASAACQRGTTTVAGIHQPALRTA